MISATIEEAPLCFVPYLKPVIWGGTKICRYKGWVPNCENIGESWEISAVPGHVSVVESGTYQGLSLTELIHRFGKDILGERVYEKFGGKFPLLVKLIDASDNLSVQVHPDDKLARQRHDSLGKTEMWYIISTEKDAKIYAGLNRKITSEIYREMVADGTFTDVVACHDSCQGDVFFLPAGRVHAIGAGNLLAEIQESSDITYRIFDYNRRDAEGNTRELHTDLAKDAIDYQVYDNYKSTPVADTEADVEIVSCRHFSVRRVLVKDNIDLEFNRDSFTIIICIDGKLSLEYHHGTMTIEKGRTILLPASMDHITVKGVGVLLTAQA